MYTKPTYASRIHTQLTTQIKTMYTQSTHNHQPSCSHSNWTGWKFASENTYTHMHDVHRRVQTLSVPSCCHLDIRGPEACICTQYSWPGLPWSPNSQPHCDLTLKEVRTYTSLLPRDNQILESLQQLARTTLILWQPAAPVDFPLEWHTHPGSLTTSPHHFTR